MAIQRLFAITRTIVTDTNAYSTNDFIGTAILSLADAASMGGTKLMTITLTELTVNALAIDFLFFATACANTTFTNNGAMDIHDTDLLQFLGHVSLVAGDYAALADNTVATKRDINLVMVPSASSTGLFCVPVARATPTYVTSALTVTFGFERE